MKLNIDFGELSVQARRMGKFQRIALPEKKFIFEPIDVELETGIKIDPSKYSTKGDVLLAYDGRHVVMYIKDHSYIKNGTSIFQMALQDPQKGNKVHVANCKTLQQMAQQNKFNRYVGTNRINGQFIIEGPKSETGETELMVCQNCLELLNYKNSRGSASNRLKNSREFNFSEFFKTYSSVFPFKPKTMDNEKVGYTNDWEAVSKSVRQKANYECSDCGISLIDHKKLCHVHHVNGVKSDNSLQNLQVLCLDCHRKVHGTNLYVSHDDMKTITDLRKSQRVVSNNPSWDDVFNLSDPAIHGELEIMKKNGFDPPEVGYDLVNPNTGAVFAQLEVAWPASQQGIAIEPLQVAGWTIWKFGDILKMLER